MTSAPMKPIANSLLGLGLLLFAATANAHAVAGDLGDRVQQRMQRHGERIDDSLDRHGDRIAGRGERRGERVDRRRDRRH